MSAWDATTQRPAGADREHRSRLSPHTAPPVGSRGPGMEMLRRMLAILLTEVDGRIST